jgi:hypothetical protein
MDALNRGRNSLIAASALILFAIFYYSLIYRFGLNLADEGNVALISQRLMHGERPFRDIAPGYNVLWFYPISTLFRVFGTHLLLMRAYFYAISTGSGLLAFFLLRRLDAPLWLAFAQGLLVISVNGQYFKAYVPFLVLANLFALTLFLTSQRRLLVSLGAGVLLGSTFLIRIDIGLSFSLIWFGVIFLHALFLDRRLRLNLFIAGNLLLGVVAMHLPFLYDAHHRHFLPQFLNQYPKVASLVLMPFQRDSPALVTSSQERQGSLASPSPPVAANGNSPATIEKPRTHFHRSPFRDIFSKSSTVEKRLLAFLTYMPALSICALFLTGLYLRASKRLQVDRWLLFSAFLAGSLAVFPQFFVFRPDLLHLIEFMNGGLVALTCAGWLLWSSQGDGWLSTTFFATIGLIALCYLSLTVRNQEGGTLAIRKNRETNFRGENGVDVFLNKAEFEEVNSLFLTTILNSTKRDYVVCYPYLPGVNFITGRPTFQNSHDLESETHLLDWEQIEIGNIRKFRPAVIIIDDRTVNGSEDSRFSHWAPELTKFVETRYRPVASINSKRAFALLTPSI